MKVHLRTSNKIIINISFFYTLFIFAICYTVASPILIELSIHVGKSIGIMGTIFSFYFGWFLLGSFLAAIFLILVFMLILILVLIKKRIPEWK